MTHAARALVAAAALLAAATAQADEVAEARSRFEQGAQQFRAGRYREAIAAFEAAYRLKPHGAIHFNVAQCRERLGEWPAALRSYQDYLRELPEARDRAAVRAAIVRLEQRLAGAGVQALLVYTDPPGAAVRLDGKPRGRTPFHITLAPGAYRVALALDGFAPEEQEVEVTAAASRVVEVVLRAQGRPAPGPALAQAPATAAAPARAAAPAPAAVPSRSAAPDPAEGAGASAALRSTLSSGVPLDAPAPRAAPDLSATQTPTASTALLLQPDPPAPSGPAPSWRARRVGAWIGAAASLALVSAGVTYGLQARDAAGDLRDGTQRTSLVADELAARARSKARTANWLYGLGGAAAAASATLFVLDWRY